MAALSPEFYSQLKDSLVSVLSRTIACQPQQISFALLDQHELDYSTEPGRGSHSLFATFLSDPNSASVTLELDTRLAAMIVDRVLGGDGSPANTLRSLTNAERAVIEFLCLSFANEVNQQFGGPVLRLVALGEKSPWELSRLVRTRDVQGQPREVWQRGIATPILLSIENVTGVLHAHFTSQSLQALDEARRRMREGEGRYSNEELANWIRLVPDVGLAVLVGRTDLTLQEFSQLEAGDVMTVEWPAIRWRAGEFSGIVSLRVGETDETLINGHIIGSADAKPQHANALQLNVASLKFEPAQAFAGRLNMQDQVETSDLSAEGNLIDSVTLTVRVELAARRIRMDELLRLRPGQILDLGCQPTDPVDLVVDGRRVARGELVDIEGRLGVRITQITG
jgi:flagellar motor switch protein FliN